MSDIKSSEELDEVVSLLAMLENCCDAMRRNLALDQEASKQIASLAGIQRTLATCQVKLKGITATSSSDLEGLSTKVSPPDRIVQKASPSRNKQGVSREVPTFFEEEAEYEERERLMQEHGETRELGGGHSLSSRIRVLPEVHTAGSNVEKVGKLRVISA